MISKVFTFRTNHFLTLFLFLTSYCCLAQEVKLAPESEMVKNKQQDIQLIYHSDVVGVSKNGIIKGRNAINTYLRDFYTNHGVLQEFKTHYRRSVVSGLDYEIGSFQTKKGSAFMHIIIWTKENDLDLRIVEVVYEMSGNKEVPAGIAKAREKWMTLCNTHNSNKLVTELYTEDAIYYNRGRVLKGHNQLSQEYSYMQNPSYKLQLTPEHIEMVSDDMAFEIGKCDGSYYLPYILVWKKQSDGSWKIFMDSNY